MALFGIDTSNDILDRDMRQVLDVLARLGRRAPEMLTPEEARRQPSLTDGLRQVLRTRGIEGGGGGVVTRDLALPGPAGEIRARLYRPDGEDGDAKPIVASWPGGGWVTASLDDDDPGIRSLTRATGCLFLSCQYRQGPEAKFPAAHEDAWSAWQWLGAHAGSLGGDPGRMAVIGEGAGGNLALNVAIRARHEGGPAPRAQVLVCPMAAGEMEGDSYSEHEFARPLGKALVQWMIGHYLRRLGEAADRRMDLVSADLAGLAPTTIIAAGIDPLRSEGELLAERLRSAGVEVDYSCHEGVAHGFFGLAPLVKDAAAAQARAAAALRKELRIGVRGKLAFAWG